MGQPMGQSKGDFLLSPGFHPKTSETLSLPHPPPIWAEAAETEVDSWFKLICVTSFHSQPTGNQHHVPGELWGGREMLCTDCTGFHLQQLNLCHTTVASLLSHSCR